MNRTDYALYRRYCDNPAMQPILNAMIILPVLVAAFNEIKSDVQVHESDEWFSALKELYRRQKMDFVERLDATGALTLAQEIMGLPITKALGSIAVAFDDAAEDS